MMARLMRDQHFSKSATDGMAVVQFFVAGMTRTAGRRPFSVEESVLCRPRGPPFSISCARRTIDSPMSSTGTCFVLLDEGEYVRVVVVDRRALVIRPEEVIRIRVGEAGS